MNFKNVKTALFSSFLVSFLILSIGFSPSFAAESAETPSLEDITYGDLYVVTRKEISEKRWESRLNYYYGFSNPYLHVHAVGVAAQYRLNPYIGFAVEGIGYTTKQKKMTSLMETEMKINHIQLGIYKPVFSVYPMVSVVPLSGLVNWFGGSPVSFDLQLSVGPGFSKYDGNNGRALSGRGIVMPQIFLTKNFGFNAGLEAVYDIFEDNYWQNRVSVFCGVVGRL